MSFPLGGKCMWKPVGRLGCPCREYWAFGERQRSVAAVVIRCYVAAKMDGLSRTYEDLLAGTYDCMDRIVLNAYFRMGHDAGGFRVWWRKLTGSEDTLNNAHLMRMAGRFSRRLRAWAAENDIPSAIAV